MKRIALTSTLVAAILAAAASGMAAAQNSFPSRPIKIVNPLPVGSAPDVVSRVTAEELAGLLGQQVIVENRPGAGGLIAAQAVAGAPADGYTLLLGVSSIWTNLPLQKNVSINVNRDFVQVGMLVARVPIYLAASSKLGITTFPEFVKLAKSKPGQVIIGTNGAGSLPHFAGLALAKMGNLPINVVPYNQGGTAAAIADILGGRVHATIEAVFGMRNVVDSGDLKLVGVMTPERDPLFPDVPTVAETVPGYSAVGFMSIAAPAGTPDRIVQRLDEALRNALQKPKVRQRFEELRIPVVAMTSAETKTFIAGQQKIWWPLVKEFGPR
jgi:tripartite-type tricarboxylate transporter receptor subunit TctC